ncbi:MAG: RdgB/HAM1 family non-canonical purine NTP pyrophosphatase [Rhodocyclales bacterium]|nr:RdgB/HAM1 family non-canonical purine NTP pyrophosphatase [Rhodocyclales bacterium]
MKKLVLASNNAKKLKELVALVAPLGIEVIPQGELGVSEAEEPHCTFIENALAKARHAAAATGLPALADDSGLCVAALGGAPGVQSARYAGEPKSDARNNEKLLEALAGHADRRAHFVSLLVLVRHAEDPQPIIAEGEWHGEILPALRGEGGFGYDPLFLDPASGLTAAELPAEIKNQRSHRGQAMQKLLERLQNSDGTESLSPPLASQKVLSTLGLHHERPPHPPD